MNIKSSTNHPNLRLVHHKQSRLERVNVMTDKNVPKISTKGGVKKPFPVKLMDLLNHIDKEEPDLADIVSWQPNGKYFKVHDKASFEKQVQPRFFAQTSYTSFRRQLNLWNFKRVKRDSQYEDKSDVGSYYHPDFVRDDPYRCRLMRKPRDNKKASTKRKQLSSLLMKDLCKDRECCLSPCPPLNESDEPENHNYIPHTPSLTSWSESTTTESDGSLNAYSNSTNYSASYSNEWARQGHLLCSNPSYHRYYKNPNCYYDPSMDMDIYGLDFMIRDIEPIEDIGEASPMTLKAVAMYLKEVLEGIDD